MKILVTGGAGFIGSHIVDRYLKEDNEVIIVDNLSTGSLANVNPDAKFYLIDIRASELGKIIEIEKPDIVNHHAAQISVPLSIKDPISDADINIIGLLNVLQECVKYNVKKVIFSSTGGAIYGEAEEYPTSENYVPKPISPYAINKLSSEKYLYYYYKQFGLNYTVLRYANVYGPRQIPCGEAGVVSIFIENLLANKQSYIYTYNGEPEGMIRDYVYVKDVAEANVIALEKGNNEIINIGTNKETKTKNLYEIIYTQLNGQITRKSNMIEPIMASARPGDVHKSCLNIDKAKEILLWTPKYSLLDGIKETIDYFRE